jgi:hypothetical protein
MARTLFYCRLPDDVIAAIKAKAEIAGKPPTTYAADVLTKHVGHKPTKRLRTFEADPEIARQAGATGKKNRWSEKKPSDKKA